jgi:hypothetical protein
MVDKAAQNGHLDIVQWAHEKHYPCTIQALRLLASTNEELHIFLPKQTSQEPSPPPLAVPSSSSSSQSPLAVVFKNLEILKRIVVWIGPKQFRFIAAINRKFHQAYTLQSLNYINCNLHSANRPPNTEIY